MNQDSENTNHPAEAEELLPLAAFLAVAGFLLYWSKGRGRSQRALGGYDRYENQFNGAFPRNSGARSEVSGGDPEDLNGMPSEVIANNAH